MKVIRGLEFHTDSKEEKLPGFSPNFPYIASRAELDCYREPFVPWHWHKAVELFYIESGELRYHTPNGTMVFSEGSGGMVNSNVLHMTSFRKNREKNIQLLHIFDPVLIAGQWGSLIEQKYITPLITASRLELIALYPDNPRHASILHLIRQAFELSEDEFGYELNIREALSQIWFRIVQLCRPALLEKPDANTKAIDKIKSMMIYIHEHYSEKISVSELSAAAYLSERECYRVFQSCLHMTPTEYMKSYRLQMACRMLAEGQESVTEIGHACGLGSTSYFGKIFHTHTGCTPLEYRRKWQDNNKNWQQNDIIFNDWSL